MPHASCDDGRYELLFPLDRLMLWYLISSLAMSLAAILIYFYFWRHGQFEDSEDVRYQIFRNDENE